VLTNPRRTPDLVPALSAGKHRNPRKGACFMEMASFLAGERWSDHPACTHPLLAELSRQVNDRVADDNRQRLLPMVPSVIGLTSNDPYVDARLALLAASTALPVAPEPTQRAMAVAVLTCNRVIASLDGPSQCASEAAAHEALEKAPHAATWAEKFSAGSVPSVRAFRRYAAPHTVRLSAEAISSAAISQRDQLLCDLLEQAIDQFPNWTGWPRATAAPTTERVRL
jgi:hypothetical protein